MSSQAVSILAELRQHQVEVERHGDRIRMKAASPPPADLIARVSTCKAALLALLPDAERPTRAVVHFRLPDHPANAFAALLGRPGESREAVLTSLLKRWPEAQVRS